MRDGVSSGKGPAPKRHLKRSRFVKHHLAPFREQKPIRDAENIRSTPKVAQGLCPGKQVWIQQSSTRSLPTS